MGACTGSGDTTIHNKKVQYYRQPTGTESLKDKELPILDFYVMLSDVKVKKCPVKSIGFRFAIEHIDKFSCSVKEVDSTKKAYWKVKHLFDFMLDQYHLRKKFLIVQAINEKQEVIGSLKINVYTIWTGPFHQDFAIKLGGGQNCRVSFNFRISQGVHVKLQNTLTQFIPEEVMQEGTRITFTMESIMGEKTEPSNFAHHVCIQDHQGMSKGLHGDFPAARNVRKDKIQWSKQHSQLPDFNEKIPFYQVYSSSMHFTFWRVEPGIIDPAQPKYQPLGSCYIPLSKLMAMDFTVKKDEVTNIDYADREIQLRQKLWHHGEQLGMANLKISFLMQIHLRQMQSCVRTQDGIMTSSPVFANFAGHQCQDIKTLGQINTEIQKQFINLDDAIQKNSQFSSLKEIVVKIHELLQKQLKLLRQTHKQSSLVYNYANEDDFMKGQRFLIFFAFKMLSYIREDIAHIKGICWEILITILRRGEFKLAHMEFTQQERLSLKNGEESNRLKFKKEISVKYLQLLNQLMYETLRSLERKGHQKEQSFAQKFCAYAYFRLPLFRQHILEILKSQNDPQLPQWRGIQTNLYEQSVPHPNSQNFYNNLFNWQRNFLQPLYDHQRFHAFTHTLQKILLQQRWKLRLAKRKTAFYKFLQNLIQQIQYVGINSKHIEWHCLPGYNKLLHAFLTEMKTNRIKQYSDVFCKCCVKLLANHKLLNVMVVLMLNRSNVNDPQTVAITFQMLDQFFKTIKYNKRPIPGTFDYKFLLKGIKIVLDSQFQASISKVILFFYDNFNIFAQQFSLELALYLLTKYFHRFFFHWSYGLRHIFQTFVFIKLSRYDQQRDDFRSGQSGYFTALKTALHQRYHSLLEEINEEIQPQAPNKNIDRFIDKDLYKKMKIKLQRKTQRKSVQKSKSIFECIDSPPKFLFPTSNEIGSCKPFQSPKKLLYFKEHEMKLQQIKQENMGYVRLALQQYNDIVIASKQQLKLNPDYTPQIKIRKIKDEMTMLQQNTEQW